MLFDLLSKRYCATVLHSRMNVGVLLGGVCRDLVAFGYWTGDQVEEPKATIGKQSGLIFWSRVKQI